MSNLIRSSRHTAGAVPTVLALAIIALVLAAVLLSPPGAANAQASTDATLSALTVSPKDIIGFASDRASYEVGVASTVTQATVAATANDSGATVAITPGQPVDLSAGKNTVTVMVTAQDGTTTKTYMVNVNQGVTDTFGWKAADDLDGLIAAGNQAPNGTWSDGETIWVSDLIDKKIYAYRKSDGSRNASEDFDTLRAAQNESPTGIWSDGATMWVADNADKKLYAYRLSEKTRDASKEFNTLEAARNEHPVGLWSDGATMWVSDYDDDKLYAYRMSDKARDAGKDFDTLSAAANGSPRGIWSDGTTMWVADDHRNKIFAYQASDKARDAGKDFDTLSGAGNTFASAIWSDGTTMWVTDITDDKVHSYNMPLSTDATLSALTVSPKGTIELEASRHSPYEVGLASTVTQATITATATNSNATISYGTTGHQVDLSAGQNAVTITVTAQDGRGLRTPLDAANAEAHKRGGNMNEMASHPATQRFIESPLWI